MSCWHTQVPYLLDASVHSDEVLALVVCHRRAQIQITTGQSGHNDAISHFRDTAPVPHAKKYLHGILSDTRKVVLCHARRNDAEMQWGIDL
jgi:hypothetical protein